MLGILLVDKPLGITSHDVVGVMRRVLNTKRVGHAGTLDPLATGLLVVAVGPATRFLQYLPLEPKVYEGEIAFGVETTTQDREGEIVIEKPVPDDLQERIAEALPKFHGLIQQLPPMFSAVKMGGRALYTYARKGEDLEREPRTVHIDSWEVNGSHFKLTCSGGTYVRTLAHDLGQAVGCGAHLASLRRTGVGRFDISGAKPMADVSAQDLISLTDAIPPMQFLHLNETQETAIRQGKQIGNEESAAGPVVALVSPKGDVFGVARVEGNALQPECVLPYEAIHGEL